jgi:hypothetical protein
MRFLLMIRMLVLVGAMVDISMLMLMPLLSRAMTMCMSMFVAVGMLMIVTMSVRVGLLPMRMFMLMGMLMLVFVLMLMRVLAFHTVLPSTNDASNQHALPVCTNDSLKIRRWQCLLPVILVGA